MQLIGVHTPQTPHTRHRTRRPRRPPATRGDTGRRDALTLLVRLLALLATEARPQQPVVCDDAGVRMLGDAPMAVTPPETGAAATEGPRCPSSAGHAARGAKLAAKGRHDLAVKAFTHALVQQPHDVAMLLNRAQAFLKTAEGVSSRPASEADMDRRSGPGDSHTLAGLALRDVDRALESGACTTDQMITGYLLRGHSRFTTEDYTAALDAYSDGLTFDPMHSELLACVRKARGMTSQRRLKRKAREESSGAQSGPAGASAGSQQSECDLPDAAASGSGDDDERGRKSLTCSLCRKLMFDPVTAPTGNSFCRYCLQRALAEKPVCPVTQKVIHMNARRFPVRLSRSRVLFEPARTTVR